MASKDENEKVLTLQFIDLSIVRKSFFVAPTAGHVCKRHAEILRHHRPKAQFLADYTEASRGRACLIAVSRTLLWPA